MSNANKFAIIPAHEGNCQIVKYSSEYINKVLNNMKTKHAQEVEESYYFKQALSEKDYKSMIDELEAKMFNCPND